MPVGIDQEDGRAVIRVSGQFDVEGAAKLRAVFMAHSDSAPTPVLIDFTKAHDITDIALAALLEVVRAERLQVRIRGLTQRHSRMMQLLSRSRDEVLSPVPGAPGESRSQRE